MQFEYYVLNYDTNHKCVEQYNVFNNWYVNEQTEKEIRKYLRSPKKYSYKWRDTEYFGFEAFAMRLRSIIMSEEWGRCEYEILVGDLFTADCHDLVKEFNKNITLEQIKDRIEKECRRNAPLEKWDCFKQCEPNIKMIAREVIWQYKEQIKKMKEDLLNDNRRLFSD